MHVAVMQRENEILKSLVRLEINDLQSRFLALIDLKMCVVFFAIAQI